LDQGAQEKQIEVVKSRVRAQQAWAELNRLYSEEVRPEVKQEQKLQIANLVGNSLANKFM
jgi:hypothetical protein